MTRRSNRNAEAGWARAVLLRETAAEDKAATAGWRAAWDGLDLPVGPGAPPGFAGRLWRTWAAEREEAAAPLLGGVWMRAAAAAALLAGLALGTTLGESAEGGLSGDDSWSLATLSEEYVTAIASPDAVLAAPPPPAAENGGGKP